MNRLQYIIFLSLILLSWSCKQTPAVGDEPASDALMLGLEGYNINVDVKSVGRADDISIFEGEELSIFAVKYTNQNPFAWPVISDYLINTQSASVVTAAGARQGEIKYYSTKPVVFPDTHVAVFGLFPTAAGSGVVVTQADNVSPKVDVTLNTVAAQQHDIMLGYIPDLDRSGLNQAGSKFAEMTFNHTLALVKLKIKTTDEVDANQILTQITANTNTKASITDLQTMTYTSHSQIADISLYDNSTGVTLSTAIQDIPGEMMIFPEPSKLSHLNLIIQGQNFKVVVPDTFELKQGNINTITLIVDKLGVRFDSFEISKWATGSSQNENTSVEPFTTQFRVKLLKDYFGAVYNEAGTHQASVKINGAYWLEDENKNIKIDCDLSADGYLTFTKRISTLMLNDNPITLSEFVLYKDGATTPLISIKSSASSPLLSILPDATGDVVVSSSAEPMIVNLAFNGIGNGTVGFPYEVSSAQQLAAMAGATSATEIAPIYFTQINDIDLGDYLQIDINGNSVIPTKTDIGDAGGWKPIGTVTAPFRGVFNGNNKQIKNLNIKRLAIDTHQGLFGCVMNPLGGSFELKNINIDGYLSVGGDSGALVGMTKGSGKIDNCNVTAMVITASNSSSSNTSYVGGVVGSARGAGDLSDLDGLGVAITNTHFNTSRSIQVSETEYIKGSCFGGVVGMLSGKSSIANCSNKSTGIMRVEAADAVGGIVGIVEQTATVGHTAISDCVNDMNMILAGNESHGGIVGKTLSGVIRIENCINNGSIDVKASSGKYTGGIVGQASDVSIDATNLYTIENCVNNGRINATEYVGGILGYAVRSNPNVVTSIKFKIINCKNAAEITSNGTYTGGIFAGFNYADPYIELCENSGNITVNSDNANIVGGIIGGGLSSRPRPINVVKSKNSGNITSGPIISNNYLLTAGMGGIVGCMHTWNNSASLNIITECSNSGNIVSNSVHAAGIIGSSRAIEQYILSDCYNVGAITCNNTHAEAMAAGIVVSGAAANTVSNCYNSGIITANKAAGIAAVRTAVVTQNNCHIHTGTTADPKATITDMTTQEALNVLNAGRSIWTQSVSLNDGKPILNWQMP